MRGSGSELARSLILTSPHLHIHSLTPARAHISLVLHEKKRKGENSTYYSVHIATLVVPSLYYTQHSYSGWLILGGFGLCAVWGNDNIESFDERHLGFEEDCSYLLAASDCTENPEFAVHTKVRLTYQL